MHKLLLALLVVGIGVLGPARAPAQPALTFPNPTPGGGFGAAVAIIADDVLVGARGDFGVAHLFDGTTGALLRTFPPPTVATNFGQAVAPFGGNALIAANEEVHLFDASTGALLRTFLDPTPGPGGFGSSVAAVGGKVLVGAPRDDTAGTDVGAAYLFDGATGTLLQTFLPPSPTGWDLFGTSVAAAGSNVVIGAPGYDYDVDRPGAAYLFDGTTGALLQTFTKPPGGGNDFGRAVGALGGDILVGATTSHSYEVPAVYLFDATTAGLLRTFTDLPGASEYAFGQAMSVVGSNLLVGASDHRHTDGAAVRGAAILFDGTTGAVLRTYQNPSSRGYSGDGFASAVALGPNTAVVGAKSYSWPEFYNGVAYQFCGGTAGCGPCETCGPAGSCVLAPHSTCDASSDSLLRIAKLAPASWDRILWKGRGYAASGDFGDPRAVHDYTLCLWDESGGTPTLTFRATAPADGTCGTRDCWRLTRKWSSENGSRYGFKYGDPQRTPDGIAGITLRHLTTLRHWAADWPLAIRLQGIGEHLSDRPLGLPLPPLNLPLRAQLQMRDGRCWEAVYSTASLNSPQIFRAEAD